MTSRLGTGKSLTFFYSAETCETTVILDSGWDVGCLQFKTDTSTVKVRAMYVLVEIWRHVWNYVLVEYELKQNHLAYITAEGMMPVTMCPRPMYPRTKVLGRCVPWKMRPLDDASPVRCVPWTLRPLDDASPGRCVPWTLRPLADASPWRCVPDDVSRPWTAHWHKVLIYRLPQCTVCPIVGIGTPPTPLP